MEGFVCVDSYTGRYIKMSIVGFNDRIIFNQVIELDQATVFKYKPRGLKDKSRYFDTLVKLPAVEIRKVELL